MPTTPNYALRYPALSVAPNVPLDFQNLALDTDAALTALDVRLDAQEVTAVADSQLPSGTTTSSGAWTSTLTGGTACGVPFVAPPSGRVLVFNTCDIASSGAFAYCGIRVRTGASIGAGSDVLPDTVANALRNNSAAGLVFSRSKLVTGLTPGASYNAQQRFIVDGGTGSFANKELVVVRV